MAYDSFNTSVLLTGNLNPAELEYKITMELILRGKELKECFHLDMFMANNCALQNIRQRCNYRGIYKMVLNIGCYWPSF